MNRLTATSRSRPAEAAKLDAAIADILARLGYRLDKEPAP